MIGTLHKTVRRRARPAVAAALAFVIAATLSACGEREVATGERYHSVEHDGARQFRVYLPGSYRNATPLPVVLVFHGGGGSIDGMVKMSRLDESAESHGFIAAYLAGSGPRGDRFLTWNAGSCCGFAAENTVDDVGFVAKVIDFLEAEYAVDATRIYATGHSNGAQMTYRLACELSERIAAIAPNAAQGVFDECPLRVPVPTLHTHGTEDRCARYGGGDCGGCFQDFIRQLGAPVEKKTWACSSVPEAVSAWAARNGCNSTTRVTLTRGAVTCESFLGCPPDADVVFCPLTGAGHTWPGGDDGPDFCRKRPDGRACTRWRGLTGEINRDVGANELLWEFFERHRRPVASGEP